MGVANTTDNTVTPIKKGFVAFSRLHLGDRFQLEGATGAKYPIFTKIRHDLARAHSHESRALKHKGYGQIGDALVTVQADQLVKFIPVE